MSRVIDLTGRRFSKLLVSSRSGSDSRGEAKWHCLCDCGNQKDVTGYNLRAGITRSCGCLKLEATVKHGYYRTSTYRSWQNMKSRCENPNAADYHLYGGRGISFCDRWQKFENFLADMGAAPPNTSIDRKDNNGNYEPDNCRWATDKEQCNNKRVNRLVTINGKTQTLKQWSESLNIHVSTVYFRMKRGLSVEAALTTPLSSDRKPLVSSTDVRIRQLEIVEVG